MRKVFDISWCNWHHFDLVCKKTGVCFIFDLYGKRAVVVSSDGVSTNSGYSIISEARNAILHYIDVRNGLYD